MSGHTPGPWHVAPQHMKRGVGYVYGPDCVVAKCGDFTDKELVPFNAERWNADAALCAAAPDLLAACNAVMVWWDEHQYDTTGGTDGEEYNVYPLGSEPEMVTLARAAIARATGDAK